jgi:hypothetical protein
MKTVAKFAAVMVIAAGLGAWAVLTDINRGLSTDRQACLTLNADEVAHAVIADVIRPDNRTFADQHLTADDVHIKMETIQIGPTSAHVLFTTSKHPDVEWAGMPRCADLQDVEYGH